MTGEVWLSILILGGELSLGVGLYLVARRVRSSLPADPGRSLDRLGEELIVLERKIDGKFDLLVGQITSQAGWGSGLTNLAEALKQRTAEPAGQRESKEEAPERSITPWPADVEPVSSFARPTPRIEALLGHPDFLSGVWTGMDGDFHTASGYLLRYLSEKGVPEPRVEAFPPMIEGNPNHWIFLVVDVSARGHRILIPRNFSRYDPALHDHLFEVRGKQATLDNFIRELQKCALLGATGELQGFIDRDLVEEKGAVVV